MDNFTANLLEPAYVHALHWEKHRDKHPVTLTELAQALDWAWGQLCNAWVVREAEAIQRRIPAYYLARSVARLWDWVVQDPGLTDWEPPADPAQYPAWTAWAMAAIRWRRACAAGQFPTPDYTPAELTTWLAARINPTRQLSLF